MIPSYPFNISELSGQLPIQRINPRWLSQAEFGANIELSVLRLDLTDPNVSGNKWFKLAKNLSEAKRQGYKQLLSFGGAYSNHIYSFSSACAEAGLLSVAVIRGDELSEDSNPMLQKVRANGTKLIFVDRASYRCKYQSEQLDFYRAQVGDFFLIPEGGSSQDGVAGAESIGELVFQHEKAFDHLMLACGTGATLAGIVRGLFLVSQKAIAKNDSVMPLVHGFSSFGERSVDPEAGWLFQEVQKFIGGLSLGDELFLGNERSNDYFSLHADSSMPGYGRISKELVQFADEFLEDTGILLDPVYTLKLMAFVKTWIQRLGLEVDEPQRILCIHTGGLHGWLGYLNQFDKKPDSNTFDEMPAQLLGTIKQRLLS